MDYSYGNQVNYWGNNENFEETPKPKRSIKKKLFIVFSFVFILAITPSLIYTLMNLDLSTKREVSMASPITQEQIESNSSEPEVHTVYVEEPKLTENQTIVINNDSYWKITKRVCGNGNNYLQVQEQNDSKPLHTGDSVVVNCNL